MTYTVVGLGNPGEEYEHTRHNVGRMVVERFVARIGATDWRADKTLRAQVAQGVCGDANVYCILPENYMNRSGGSVAPKIKTARDAERLVVVQDDIDLPLGTLRIVFDRGAGGHNGVRSIERAIKTRAFVRIRIGVVPMTPSGKPRKPRGEDAVHTFILKQLTKREYEQLQPILDRAVEALCATVAEGREAAMRTYNGSI